MERFLNDEAIHRSQRRVRRIVRIFFALAAFMLILFVALCLLTRTGNARFMLFLTVLCMILPGWILIVLWQFELEPARSENRHLESLSSVEPETREGRFFLSADHFRIPKSVRVRKVRLETEEETLSLNLNEKLARRMPPDGSLVRVETARKFITGIEVLEAGPRGKAHPKPSRAGGIFRAFGRFFLPALLWAVLALIFTGFVFSGITDTAPENKIVLYADCEVLNAPELAEKLEKALSGSVRMVKIHPFTYAMFNSAGLRQADLYLIPDSHREEYREWFAPEEGPVVYDPASGISTGAAYFLYEPSDIYRLYPGQSSVHLEDGLALRAAELLISITDTAKEETP